MSECMPRKQIKSLEGLMQAEAPIWENSCKETRFRRERGARSGPLLGQHEEGPMAPGISVPVGERWPVPSMQPWTDLHSPPRDVLCELSGSLRGFLWLQRTPALLPRAPSSRPHDSAGTQGE